MERIGLGMFHYTAAVICGLGNASDAVELLAIGYVGAELHRHRWCHIASWLEARAWTRCRLRWSDAATRRAGAVLGATARACAGTSSRSCLASATTRKRC